VLAPPFDSFFYRYNIFF